ncbi:MAG: nucleotidyltransferase domain-containing protein [Candidatus Kuenenia stuttgartiensis]|uniref:nucleotidyltransferase domain-containing protein n=1 Tax=Kuenenia stuttgartiensis TaxID=174633 RepID=UPI000C0705F4|nr:nucleotidyltransferase domain-containing protein [Planctomycetia bacterium]MBW7940993.1 nucleotidyltransferase domain-containing protein [Candidatus Kuenenia stuttgartiensis]MBZ0193200.1 nucleotidyltransferase domain-containing protein [Candidatus Kuenenia stuttgartiensis]MCL4725698.1 nucleotidyltransferase domain-containing protein [Candidatus Kuenenia stuttgartiensis]
MEAINRCFAVYSRIEQVVLCGSRAIGNYKDGSDIDLTILTLKNRKYLISSRLGRTICYSLFLIIRFKN